VYKGLNNPSSGIRAKVMGSSHKSINVREGFLGITIRLPTTTLKKAREA